MHVILVCKRLAKKPVILGIEGCGKSSRMLHLCVSGLFCNLANLLMKYLKHLKDFSLQYVFQLHICFALLNMDCLVEECENKSKRKEGVVILEIQCVNKLCSSL